MEWQNSGKFPRVTLCDFDIRVLGNIHRHTVQCVLVINMFTEKIFIFLWIWFLILTIVTSVNFLFYAITLLIPALRVNFIMKYLDLSDAPPDREKDKKHIRKFVIRFLRPDGVFILRMVAANSGTVLSTELVYSLWLRYREAVKSPKLSVEPGGSITKIPSEKSATTHSSTEAVCPDRRKNSKESEEMPWTKLSPPPLPLGNHKPPKGKFVPEKQNSSHKSSPVRSKSPTPGQEDEVDEGEMHYA